MAHGVGNEILQDAGEGIRIGQDDEVSPRGLVGHAEFRLPASFFEFRVMAYQHAFDKRAKRDGLHVERKVGGFGVGEELVEQSRRAVDAGGRGRKVELAGAGIGLVVGKLEISFGAGERRANVMRECREVALELILVTLRVDSLP